MSFLPWIIFLPFLYAVFIPFFYKKLKNIHTGWFVLPLPIIIFIYLFSLIKEIANGETILQEVAWIPSLGINITTYLDGLSLIFGLLIEYQFYLIMDQIILLYNGLFEIHYKYIVFCHLLKIHKDKDSLHQLK